MKKIFYAIVFLCVSTFAIPPHVSALLGTETCDYWNGEKMCTTAGYICEIGINTGRFGGPDAMYFYLGTTPNCDMSAWYLTGDNDMKTCFYDIRSDANGNAQPPIVSPSTATKFFLNNDNVFAGPLAMTVMGSIALSAYNNSSIVSVIYTKNAENIKDYKDANGATQRCLVEHSGIRFMALWSNK